MKESDDLKKDGVQQLNIYSPIDADTKNTNTKLDNGEISIGNEKANIAVATSSPVDDVDLDFGVLPKVENASIIQPSYSSGSVVKTSDDNQYNIYNTVPNIMDSIKEEIKNDEIVKGNDDEKINVNVNPDNVVVKNNIVSDDEFFDDFFGDD